MKPSPIAVWALLIVPAAAGAYWAPNHEQMNWNIFCKGRPWDQAGFKRSNADVTDVFGYSRRVLYLTEPGKCGDAPKIRKPKSLLVPRESGRYLYGVKYIGPAESNKPGLDRPQDEPTERLSLLDWYKRGGLWEDGFNDMDEAVVWGGRRAVNHFHDPLTGSGGYTGVTAVDGDAMEPYLNLARAGISVSDWVMNGQTKGEGGKNDWG